MKFRELIEGKRLKWKKIGDQYTAYYDDPKDVLALFMKQEQSGIDRKTHYEVRAMNGIEYRSFSKISDAKKYIKNILEK